MLDLVGNPNCWVSHEKAHLRSKSSISSSSSDGCRSTTSFKRSSIGSFNALSASTAPSCTGGLEEYNEPPTWKSASSDPLYGRTFL